MGDGGVRRHRADGCADGIQIAMGSACGRSGLRLGGEKRGKEQSAGGEAIKLHDYRVCRKLGQESTLDAGAILLKTSGGIAIEPGGSDSEPDSAIADNIFHAGGVLVMEPRIVSPGGGIHDLP